MCELNADRHTSKRGSVTLPLRCTIALAALMTGITPASAQIAYVGQGPAVGYNLNDPIGLPSGLQANDILVLTIASDGVDSFSGRYRPPTLPSGWTVKVDSCHAWNCFYVLWRRATGTSDDLPSTFRWGTGNAARIARIAAFRAARTIGDPFEAVSSVVTTFSGTLSSLTTQTPGAWVIVTAAASHSDLENTATAGIAFPSPGPYTNSTGYDYTSPGGDWWAGALAMHYGVRDVPGPAGTATVSFLGHGDYTEVLGAVALALAPAGTYPCGASPCTRGQFPPATWRPYASSSPFNTPVAPSAALIPSTYCTSVPSGSTCSGEIVKRMLGDISINKNPSHWLIANNGMTGWPTYYGTSTDPVFSIACSDFGGCPGMPSGRAPGGAIRQGADDPLGGTDRHLTFIDQTTNTEFDLWHVATSPLPFNGGTISTGYAGYSSANGDGRSSYGEGNAAGFGNLAGRIRIEEMTDATARHSFINHALTVAFRCTSGLSIYPAGSNVGQTCASIGLPGGNGNAPPMGAHIHLNMSLEEIDVLPTTVPEWKKVLLRTLSVYGAYINDTETAGFYFSWQMESGLQYASMGVPDPWLSFASSLTNPNGSNDWFIWNDEFGAGYKGLWNASDGISWDTQVWSRLRVLGQ